jgi:hypothetical protein
MRQFAAAKHVQRVATFAEFAGSHRKFPGRVEPRARLEANQALSWRVEDIHEAKALALASSSFLSASCLAYAT